jgi:hypothetical protein
MNEIGKLLSAAGLSLGLVACAPAEAGGKKFDTTSLTREGVAAQWKSLVLTRNNTGLENCEAGRGELSFEGLVVLDNTAEAIKTEESGKAAIQKVFNAFVQNESIPGNPHSSMGNCVADITVLKKVGKKALLELKRAGQNPATSFAIGYLAK